MSQSAPCILTINGGSSSIRLSLFSGEGRLERVLDAKLERIGQAGTLLSAKGSASGGDFTRPVEASDFREAVGIVMDWFLGLGIHEPLAAVSHRIVHGGPNYWAPQVMSDEMLSDLKQFSAYDPEHMPEEILLAEAFRQQFSSVPHVACFDTAFHHHLPFASRMLPIPRRFEAKGIRRYGFHGLSYEFLMEELAVRAGEKAAQGRVVLAHLGNGASLAAVKAGQPMDTSMGFTPTGGLPMSTRSGDLDPGLAWYMARTEGMDAQAFNTMVNMQSGLLGMSETSSDMRDLLACEGHDRRAAEAVACFCYQAKKWVGSFAAALGGLDTLVFSGGIGENAHRVRALTCEGLGFIGLQLDEARNLANAPLISSPDSRVAVWVLPTDEAKMMARSACRLLRIGIPLT